MDKNIPVIQAQEVITTYRHKQTGEVFKERKDWEAKGFKNEDMAQDVKVVMPTLDLFAETK
jgi:molybdenum cofactor biosynthesis enzyme MoaA